MKLGIIPLCDRDTITSPDWIIEFAQMVEEEGCESIWMPEHVVVAAEYEPLYPYSEDGRMPATERTVMPDPLHWLTFVAAVTKEVRLATGVLIGPQHSAAVLAKRLATLDVLSGGRVELGIGMGWQKEEYEAVGVPYAERGERLDETIAALRALWGPGPSTYQGEFIHFERVHSDPKPIQSGGVPIVVGGSSEAAARRAGRLGDGYYPYVVSPQVLAERIASMRRAAEKAGRDPDAIEITVWPGSYAPKGVFDLDLVKQYAALGTTRLIISEYEGKGISIEDTRNLIRDYRKEILDKF